MSDGTKIEWTDATWNPITGCSVVSAGCRECYAMKLAGTRLQHHPSRAGLTVDTKNGPVWTGEVRINEQWLDQPLRWKRPRMVFVCAHADLFHEEVPDHCIDRIFAVMALAPQHTFQVLTKRSRRMREYMGEGGRAADVFDIMRNSELGYMAGGDKLPPQSWPLSNVWLGVSVEDQAAADERIPLLLDTPATVRWISAEPLLGPVDLRFHIYSEPTGKFRTRGGNRQMELIRPEDGGLHWVVVGGESGRHARPMHPQWARDLRDQCAAAGVPMLFKQWGEWAPGENCNGPMTRTEQTADFFNGKWSFGTMTPRQSEECHIDDEPTLYRCGKKAAGRLLDGVQHDGYPRSAE